MAEVQNLPEVDAMMKKNYTLKDAFQYAKNIWTVNLAGRLNDFKLVEKDAAENPDGLSDFIDENQQPLTNSARAEFLKGSVLRAMAYIIAVDENLKQFPDTIIEVNEKGEQTQRPATEADLKEQLKAFAEKNLSNLAQKPEATEEKKSEEATVAKTVEDEKGAEAAEQKKEDNGTDMQTYTVQIGKTFENEGNTYTEGQTVELDANLESTQGAIGAGTIVQNA